MVIIMAGKYLEVAYAIKKTSESLSSEEDLQWSKDTVLESNMQIENDTRDVYKSFPTDPASDLFVSFRNAALAWFKYQWAVRERDEFGKESFLQEYKAKKNALRNVSGREETGSHRYSEWV